jgi:cytochrome c biogenesis protein CcmG/thiol:disulfide interchange protein DsbE
MSDSQAPETSASTSEAPRWLRPLAAAVIVALGLTLALVRDEVAGPVSRGVEAPAFDLPLLGAAKPVSLEQYRGKVVLLNFWATWCKPCEDEMPAMDRLYRALAPEGFEMLAVSVDEETELVESFRQRLGVSFPILMDPAQDVSRLYQTTGFPESLLIDSNGMIVERYIGPRDWDHRTYAERIRRLMKDG